MTGGRRLLALGAAVVLLCSHAASSTGGTASLPWVISRAPFAAALLGGTQHTTLGGRAAPLVFTDTAGREHPLTRVVAERTDGATTTVTLAAADHVAPRARLTFSRTPAGVDVGIAVTPASAVAALRVTLSAPASAHFLGTGERNRFVDLKGTVEPLKAWNGCGSSAPAPFFVSTAGFGAYLRSDAVGRIAFPGAVDGTSFACDLSSPSCSVGEPEPSVRICIKAASARLEVFAGTPAQTVADYVRAVGPPRAPWLPELGLMKWRDAVSGPDELLDDLTELRSRDLPVGWLILDNPWEQGAGESDCFGSLQFDPTLYPDPHALIEQVHAAGARFMLWISPELKKKGCPLPLGFANGWLTGDDEYYVRDLTSPGERADFVGRLEALAALGVDGFKADRGDEVDLEKTRLAAGPGRLMQNAYPRLYADAVRDALQATRPQWTSLFRSGSPGSLAAAGGFLAEDTQHTWNGLLAAVRMAQTASIAGESIWGSDIGGYSGGGDPTPDLFVRWAQFAATTPIFEVGGQGITATFWELGPQAVDGFRAAATLHYELAPYLFELAREASVTGAPVLRPLGLTWPADARAWASETEYTVGGALLAAPIVTADADTGGASVYLPAGTWIDYFTGRRLAGGRTIRRAPAAPGFPLYVRAGTALADNFRTPALWPVPWRPDDLSHAGRQGWVVAPAAGVTATATSNGARLTASVDATGRVVIRLTGAAPEQQLRIHAPAAICGATLDGHVLPHAPGAAALTSAAAAWSPAGGLASTVVVKARVGQVATFAFTPCA